MYLIIPARKVGGLEGHFEDMLIRVDSDLHAAAKEHEVDGSGLNVDPCTGNMSHTRTASTQ